MKEEGYRSNRLRKWLFVCLAAVFCLFAASVNAHAAGKTIIKTKVNSQFSANLEKTGGKWQLQWNETEGEALPAPGNILYLKLPAGKELKTGYYYFDKKGYLDTRKVFHTVDAKLNSHWFKGKYYFGEANGRLFMKHCWVTVGGQKYFLSSTGRMYRNCWVKDVYLKDNGQIARNMKTPDGFYVDCDGHKCAQSEMRLSNLKKSLNSMIQGFGGTWSVYVKDLKTGDELLINDKSMAPASVIKLFVMAATYDGINKGTIKKDATVTRLLNSMITVSDNESYNALVRRNSKKGEFVDGSREITKYLKKIGCKKTECHNTLHPASSGWVSDGSKRNSVSAKDAGLILDKIYNKELVSKKYSEEMLNLLLRQTRRWKIPAGLPAGTKCVNKTGENSFCQNDVAIVYGKKTDYIVCILAGTTEFGGIRGIKQLSSKIYSYLNA